MRGTAFLALNMALLSSGVIGGLHRGGATEETLSQLCAQGVTLGGCLCVW